MKIKSLLIFVIFLALITTVLGFATIRDIDPVEIEIVVIEDGDEIDPDQQPQVDLSNRNLAGYEYATISDDDTIVLINTLGDKVIINLERRAWQNISWSPDGLLVSVLGKTRDNIYDIYIFQIQSRTWIRATNFSALGIGVDSYTWKGSREITFTQGQGSERWLHSYNHESRSILKIAQTSARVIEYSRQRTYLVLKDDGSDKLSYHIHNNLGNKLLELNRFVDSSNTSQNLTISQLFSITDSDKIVFSIGEAQFAKTELGSLSAFLMDIEKSDYNFLCSINEDEYYFAGEGENKINLYILNTKRERMGVESTQEAFNAGVIKGSGSCFGQRNVLFGVNSDNSTEWLEYRNGTNNLANLFHLKGSKEVQVK